MVARGLIVLFMSTAAFFPSGGAFRCWCENTIGCGTRREMECPQTNPFDKVKSCIKISRDAGEVIRACGGAIDYDLCAYNRNLGMTTCSCFQEMCNKATAENSWPAICLSMVLTFFIRFLTH
ncbi:hypothetical protein BV898_06585 [Hypsibius exemplaris]|uniref:Protein sleepless n=1 Tax=Hypsibius exemplaris TaxID=2072580 RepID=A0A1W0WVZ2_HYPEX|nr:hypothetical protein BV898_06585 [Hypsibius exemplaris]